MPTSLSLQDLQRARRSHVSRICNGQQQQKYLHQQQQFVDIEVVEEEHLAVVEDLVAQDDEDFVSDGIVNIEDPSGLDVESEQIVVDETLDDQQIQQAISSQSNDDRNTIQMWNNQQNTDIIKFEQPGQTNMEPDNTKREEEMFLDDTPLFPHSQIGVHKFSTEFLAIAQKHRLEPKVRAILLDLLQRSMPEENQCPQTIADMHKLVAQEEVDSSSFPSDSKALFPATSNQQMTHQHNKFITSPLNARRSNQIIGEAGFAMEEEAAYSDEGDEVVYDPAMINYRNVGPSTDLCLLVPRLFETINYLQEEVAFLRSELKAYASPSNNTTSYGTVRQVKRRISNLDGRFGLHIYDEHGRKKLLGEMNPEELKRTIEISRNDGNKLLYDGSDITEMVLAKLDLHLSIHNPSLCGRKTADALFSPEYLADKHILGEGQFSSRTRLETIPPEMTQLFYDSLRKLGVSRIPNEDQEHWLYLARDGVNQRARDLKANRKRKFYVDEPSV